MFKSKSHWQFQEKKAFLEKLINLSIKGRTMKFMIYVAWTIAILTVIFFLKQPQFSRYIFQYVYLDFLRPLSKNWQNVCMWKILRLEMWNNVAHIWDIITAYEIYKIIFLDVTITLMNENWQLNSKQYTMITVYYDSKQCTVIRQICVCVCLWKCNCMFKLSENMADFQT